MSVTAGPSTGSGVWPARPRVGEVATVLAVVVAALGVLTGAPADPSTAGWAVGSLVLGAAFCAAAATVRRCGARGPTGPMSVLGVVLLLDAVAAAGAARAPALAVLDLRLTAAVLTLVGPALALTVPSGRLDARPDRVAAAVVAVAGTAVVAVPSAPVALPAGIAVAVVVSGAVWARFERSRDDDRPRMLWLVYGVGVTGVVGGHVLFVAETWNGAALAVAVTVLLLCGAVLPVTLAVALVAPRWIDVRRVIAATVLAVLMVDLVLAAFTGSLSVVGRSGTLARRMRGTSAAGRCRGKTGTLHDVSNLVGYCRTANGHLLVFAWLMNSIDPSYAHGLQDRMTVALARYRG